MPIRRPRGPKPALRYVALLEAMTEADSPATLRRHLAAFATLRLLDHWLAFGAELADPAMQSHRIARRSVRALEADDPLRPLLQQVLRSIVMLVEPDPHPLGSRLLALGEHYEAGGAFAIAAEVYGAAARMVDPSVKADWAFRSHLRGGFCLLVTGEYHWAEAEFTRASQLAAMQRDPWGRLVARVAQAKLESARGAHRDADRLMRDVAQACVQLTAHRRAPSPTLPSRARSRPSPRPSTRAAHR
jgi:hypothetical protein